jgi:hypothetical protein
MTQVWSRFIPISAQHTQRVRTGAVKVTQSWAQPLCQASFTPSANHTVTKVEVAVGFVEGTNGLVLGLYSDASGVPGKAIKTWALSSLPTFGSCCTVEARTDAAGISVTAGTQYWIVLKTNKKETTTWAAFNVNDTDQIDSQVTAFYCSQDVSGSCSNNDKWTASQSTPGPAFAVLGK